MKKLLLHTVIASILLIVAASPRQAMAQEKTNGKVVWGFDDEKQLTGWSNEHLECTEAMWALASKYTVSKPYSVVHTYAEDIPGCSADDWYVSPGFRPKNGAKIEQLSFCSTSLASNVKEGDTIGVYLLIGNQNPEKASKRVLLYDFRDDNYYYEEEEFRKVTDIAIPASEEMCYLALRYKNQDISKNLYTFYFDDIILSDVTLAGAETIAPVSQLKLFPVPCREEAVLSGLQGPAVIRLLDSMGSELLRINATDATCTIDTRSLPAGNYVVAVENSGRSENLRLIKQ